MQMIRQNKTLSSIHTQKGFKRTKINCLEYIHKGGLRTSSNFYNMRVSVSWKCSLIENTSL